MWKMDLQKCDMSITHNLQENWKFKLNFDYRSIQVKMSNQLEYPMSYIR